MRSVGWGWTASRALARQFLPFDVFLYRFYRSTVTYRDCTVAVRPKAGVYLYQKQTGKHNRQIHKCSILKGGVRKLNQSPYLVNGFRLFDKVKCLGQVGFIFGKRSSGYFDVRTLGGKKLSPAIHAKKLTLLEKRKPFLTELRKEDGASSPV